MRQVLVEKSDNIGELSFNKTMLKAHEQIVLDRGNNRLQLPFKLKVIQGGPVSFKYRIARELAAKSILLVAAFEDGDNLEAWVINMSGGAYTIEKDSPLIEISAYETVQVRQVEPGLKTGVFVVSPEKKKAAPAPTAPEKKPRKPRKKS